MPCYFCVAVFIGLSGAVTGAVIDQIEKKLNKKAATKVKRGAETDSVTKLEAAFKVGAHTVPVAITVFKEHKRVRIQVLNHEIPRKEAGKLVNMIADLLDLKVTDRSHPESEKKVREAVEAAATSMDRIPLEPSRRI